MSTINTPKQDKVSMNAFSTKQEQAIILIQTQKEANSQLES